MCSDAITSATSCYLDNFDKIFSAMGIAIVSGIILTIFLVVVLQLVRD